MAIHKHVMNIDAGETCYAAGVNFIGWREEIRRGKNRGSAPGAANEIIRRVLAACVFCRIYTLRSVDAIPFDASKWLSKISDQFVSRRFSKPLINFGFLLFFHSINSLIKFN